MTTEKPGKPTIPIRSESPDGNAIRVSWLPLPNCDKYEISFGLEYLFVEKPAWPTTTDTSYDIRKGAIPLKTVHWFRVRGVNDNGTGEWSEPTKIELKKVPLPKRVRIWLIATWTQLTKKLVVKKKTDEKPAGEKGQRKSWLPTLAKWLVIVGFIIAVGAFVRNYHLLGGFGSKAGTTNNVSPANGTNADNVVSTAQWVAAMETINTLKDKLSKMELARKGDAAMLESQDATRKAALPAIPAPSSTSTNAATNEMIVAKNGDAIAQVPLAVLRSNVTLVFGNNNIVNSAVNNEKPTQLAFVPPPCTPIRLPEPSPITGSSDTEIWISAGSYQSYVPPRGCDLFAYPQEDVQIFYDGRPASSFTGRVYVKESYGYRNCTSHSIKITMRVTRQRW